MVSRWTSVCLSVHLDVCLSVVCLSVCFSLSDDNLNKHQWIFTKLGMLLMIMAGYYSLTFL